MSVLIIFILIIVCLNCIPFLTKTLTKKTFPKTEKVILRLLITSSILFLIFTIFEWNDYLLKGKYTYVVFGIFFTISTILFLAINKITLPKVLSNLILTPLLVLSIYSFFVGYELKTFKINDNTKIIIKIDGFLACGESFSITKTKFLIFDKKIYYDSSLCLRGIENIKTIKFDNTHAEFLIYHNGKMDSENPYDYEVELKNVW